ncbi:dihydrolipoamide acetyltransferase family protein [Fontimonas sp. SYSU GA230001]|uniref:dihydrolipoamide acetyltransferase family protein n=1 Tax=Fontimonas sp. SYSU GA230001 TaxID=3142450 RepID=UPI0032B44E5D
MAEYRLPSLGADMDAATFVEWRVKPGDRVKRGDIVASVETSKGIIDIEIFESGVVEALLVQPGAHIPVGTALAQIRTDAPGAAPHPPAEAAAAAAAAAAPVGPEIAPAGAAAPTRTEPDAGHVRASPAARKRASELGVALDQVRGSGPHGVITVEDVERATAPAPTTVPPASPPPAANMRATIAAAMTRSKREIPHYYLATAIDLKAALDWMSDYNRERPVTERLLAGLLFVRAVARALTEFPDFNGFYRDAAFVPADGIHVGVAIAVRGGGLVAPALHDTDRGSIGDAMRAFQDLVTRTRSGHLRASEMADATITVTSLGERGVDAVFPVIYPPQVAIVGFGRVAQKPVVTADGGLAAHPVVQATLAADHRVGDGHRGGLFLAAIERWLQTPEKL